MPLPPRRMDMPGPLHQRHQPVFRRQRQAAGIKTAVSVAVDGYDHGTGERVEAEVETYDGG